MSRLFRSRWAALLWAAGICWTAWDVASSRPAAPADVTDATGEPVDDAALAVLANAAP